MSKLRTAQNLLHADDKLLKSAERRFFDYLYQMEKIALFPGSFDPFTAGHRIIVERALELFDRIVVGVGVNPDKGGGESGLLSIERRIELIHNVFEGDERVEAVAYEGLTVDFCRARGVRFIVRGVRNSADFEYEHVIEMANRRLAPEITTVAIFTPAELSFVSSKLVREIVAAGGDASEFLPKNIDIKEYI